MNPIAKKQTQSEKEEGNEKIFKNHLHPRDEEFVDEALLQMMME
jgi:hypothetical protein